MIKFDVTAQQSEMILQIAKRADREVFKPMSIKQSIMDTVMDISACIANGCPLRLNDLLNADELNFAHDIVGIRRHLDRRETGTLLNCFLPRFAEREVTK